MAVFHFRRLSTLWEGMFNCSFPINLFTLSNWRTTWEFLCRSTTAITNTLPIYCHFVFVFTATRFFSFYGYILLPIISFEMAIIFNHKWINKQLTSVPKFASNPSFSQLQTQLFIVSLHTILYWIFNKQFIFNFWKKLLIETCS